MKNLGLLGILAGCFCWSFAIGQCNDRSDCGTKPSNNNSNDNNDKDKSYYGWTMCNGSSSKSIEVAIGYWVPDGEWQSKGWIAIEENLCVKLLGVLKSDHFYYLVRRDGEYLRNPDPQRAAQFCILPSPKQFRFSKGNSSSDKCVFRGIVGSYESFDYVKRSDPNWFESIIYHDGSIADPYSN